jgi:hypothetical protein
MYILTVEIVYLPVVRAELFVAGVLPAAAVLLLIAWLSLTRGLTFQYGLSLKNDDEKV